MKRLLCISLALILLLCGMALAEKPDWVRRYSDVIVLKCEPVRYLGERFDNGHYDLLDADGLVLSENHVAAVGDFYEGIAIAYNPDDLLVSSFMREDGELISDFIFGNGGWWGSQNFSGGLCSVKFYEEDKYGCINAGGEIVIEPQYDFLGMFSDGLACFYSDEEELYGYINLQNEIVIPPQFQRAGTFHDGRAPVGEGDDGPFGYIDSAGELVIPMQFAHAAGFSDGLARVRTQDDSVGFIRPDGSYAIQPEYIEAGHFQGGIAAAAKGTGVFEAGFSEENYEVRLWGVIDENGNAVLPLKYDSVEIQRGANLRPEEITITAKLGDEPHYFRIEDGRAVEIAGMLPDYEITRALEKAFSQTDLPEACIDFGEGAALPYIQFEDDLYPLREMLAAAGGYDRSARTYDAARYGRFSASYPFYDELLTGYTDIKFGPAPRDQDAYEAFLSNKSYIATPIARDALVFIAEKDFPLDNLTMDQLKAIYSGEITDWAQLGADAGSITAYQWDESSWTQMEFENLMRDIWLMEPPTEYLESEYGDYGSPCCFRALPGAIGFCMRSMLDAAVQGDVKILSIDSVYPSDEAIASGSYPAAVDIHAVTRADEDDPGVQAMLDWVLSEQGREWIRRAGYAA